MPYTQPSTPNPDRLKPQPDGSVLLTLLPGDGKRLEYVWGDDVDRPPIGKKFVRTINAGVVTNNIPNGHEWCLWQLHTPDSDPALAGANPFLLLMYGADGWEIRVLHEHSLPFDNAKAQRVTIARPSLEHGKLHRWEITANISETGYVRIRQDGVLIADYAGPVGYNMAANPYFKAGIYKWEPSEWSGIIQATVKV